MTKLGKIYLISNDIRATARDNYLGKYSNSYDSKCLLVTAIQGYRHDNNYIIIGTLESYLKTREYFGKTKVLPILLEVDDGVRLQRALDRERRQENPKYEELCRRYLADAEDFSEEKIKKADITLRFSNDNLEKCLSEIEEYLLH